MNVQCSGSSRSFAKDTRTLKMKSAVTGHRKLTMTTEIYHQRGSSYNYMRSCWRTQCQPFFGHLAFEGNWKGEKAQKMDASWADWKWKKKPIILKCHLLFFYATTMNHSGSDGDVWQKVYFIQQLVVTSSVSGPRRSSKVLTNTKLAPKKGYSHCLVVCCQSDPLHHSEFQETIISEKYAQQIDEIQQLLQHLQLALVNGKGPILLHDNAQLHVTQPLLQKLNELGYKVLPHPPYSSDLSPIDYHFLKHLDNFLQGKRSHN